MSRSRAIQGVQRIITRRGFSQDITLTPPGGEPVTVKGIASRHFLEVEGDGVNAIDSNAHVLFSEPALIDAGIVVRNNDDNVNLSGYVVAWTDGTNTERTYIIDNVSPSETVGLLVCKISRYGTN